MVGGAGAFVSVGREVGEVVAVEGGVDDIAAAVDGDGEAEARRRPVST